MCSYFLYRFLAAGIVLVSSFNRKYLAPAM